MAKKKFTREQVIKKLSELESSWPDDLWIFVASGEINLMEHGENGEKSVLETHYWGHKYEVVDPKGRIAAFPRIDADAGDW